MDRWIAALRRQVSQITEGCEITHDSFEDAPGDVMLLSRDLSKIADMIAERDRQQRALTYEVHHRVKNNLQIMTSLLSLQTSKADEPATRLALAQTRARMGALALIHRLLYDQTDHSGHGQGAIHGLMQELCTMLRLWHRDRDNITFICEASAVSVSVEKAVPLALFAVEAATNAYRHAFPENRPGSVVMQYHIFGTRAVLKVIDDGIGFDFDSTDKSMGYRLMNAYVHQLDGEFSIESGTLSGTIVTLSVPAAD